MTASAIRFPTAPDVTTSGGTPPSPADFEFLVDIANKSFPLARFDKVEINPFGAAEQFPIVVSFDTQNLTQSNPALAYRNPWPTGWRFIKDIEAQLFVAPVGVDEEFEVVMFGCAYSGTGPLDAASLVALDDAEANKIVFSAGDDQTKTQVMNISALIGGIQATHIVPCLRRLGSSAFTGQVSLFIGGGP